MDSVASHGQQISKLSVGQPLPTPALHSRHAFGRKGVLLRRRVARHHPLRVSSQFGLRRGAAKVNEGEGENATPSSEPVSGTTKVSKPAFQIKSPATGKLQNRSRSQAKSNEVVFVAGATGKVGSRTVRELLKLGFTVRAGTRNVEKAQALFEDVSGTAGAAGSDGAPPRGIFSPANIFGFLKPKPGKKLEIVECNLENPDSIEPALRNAGIVVCCIGASEKEVLDISGPYRIDFKATENLINAASSAEVSHFVLLTSLGTQKFGFPAAVLNLFWGVLLWKAKAEKALLQSGIPYTIVRPGGMERPTDAYKETHNLILAEADKLFGGQVSNLQVAELIASIVENSDVSVNKIVEAVAETTAPLRPIKELLEGIPAREISGPEPQIFKQAKSEKSDAKKQEDKNVKDRRAVELKEREEMRIQAEKIAEEKRVQAQKEEEQRRIQAQKEEEQRRIQAEQDEKEKQRLQNLRRKYEEEIEAAREKADAAKTAAAAALAEKDELERKAAETRAKAEAAALTATQAKAVEAAVLAAARQGNVLSDEEKQKIMESVRSEMLSKKVETPSKQPKAGPKKGFPFLGRGPTSTTPAESIPETDSAKDIAKGTDAKSKVTSRAGGKSPKKELEEAKKLAEVKKKDEEERMEKQAKEAAEKEIAKAQQEKEAEAKRKEQELAEAKKKEEEEKAKKEAEAEAKRKEQELAEAKKKDEEERAKEAEAKRKEKEIAEAKEKEEEERAKKEAEAKLEEEEKRAKMEAEAKLKEEEERAKMEAEAKLKEEEEKTKIEAEAKLKEEEERAKMEAEAKLKEEQAEAKKKEEEEKAKMEAEAKLKEEEEMAKMEAEAKKKEEEEKAKKEAEAKLKEEEEKAKMEAEAKKEEERAEAKRKEEEEKVRTEAEANKKEEEEQAKIEAEAKRKQEELAEAQQKEEEEKRKKEVEAKEEKTGKEKLEAELNMQGDAVAETKTQAVQEKVKKEEETSKAQELESAKALVEEKATEVASILNIADEPDKQESPLPFLKGFRWFWQPAEPDGPGIEASTKGKVADVPAEAKTADQLPPCPTPLSPFTQYPGLKPPTPPVASPPVTKTENVVPGKTDPKSSESKVIDQTKVKMEIPFFETTAPSGDSQDDRQMRAQKIQEIVEREKEALEKAEAVTNVFNWPWQKKDEIPDEYPSPKIKEPESPVVDQGPASPVGDQGPASPTTSLHEKDDTLLPSSRPLSPYAQYPDLKPPSPPKPSSALQNGSASDLNPIEKLLESPKSMSPFPGFPDLKPPPFPTPEVNGATAVEAKEDKKAPEPSTNLGFKWPWQ